MPETQITIQLTVSFQTLSGLMQLKDTQKSQSTEAPQAESTIERVLHEIFKLDHLRDKQRETIDHLLSGRHCLALLPTGYGKSLCYQLPSQILPGLTVVISPLIALMQDQLDGLQRRGIENATILNSTISLAEQDRRIRGLIAGQYKLLYIAPERFDSPRFRGLLKSLKISLLVIDEAHCISQWGHDFRPQYRNIRKYLEILPDTTVLAVTATATQRVRQDIIDSLQLPQMQVVQASFDRPNLHFEVEQHTNSAAKDERLFELLDRRRTHPDGASIVYVSSRKEAEALTLRLRHQRIEAACYHAGMPADHRARVQKDFEQDRCKVIVSTVAFGMGVDKGSIDQVVHYNLPASLENYFQEAGRAGRDGRDATCTLFYQAKDVNTQKWLMKQNYPTDEQIADIYDLLANKAPQNSVSIKAQIKISDVALNAVIDLFNQLRMLSGTMDAISFKEEVKQKRVGLAGPIAGLITRCPVDTTLLRDRERRDITRLETLINYASRQKCRRLQLLNYFGQPLEQPCTGCDVCHDKNSKDSAKGIKVKVKPRAMRIKA